MHGAWQAGEQEPTGLNAPRGPSSTGHAHSPPRRAGVCPKTHPCFLFLCLGFSRVPASLFRSRQGLPSAFGQNASACSSDPPALPGHEPLGFMEARLLIVRAAACLTGRPPHSLLCRPVLLLSWEVCLQSVGHPRPQLSHPPRGRP